jgi:hypothetical protein
MQNKMIEKQNKEQPQQKFTIIFFCNGKTMLTPTNTRDNKEKIVEIGRKIFMFVHVKCEMINEVCFYIVNNTTEWKVIKESIWNTNLI